MNPQKGKLFFNELSLIEDQSLASRQHNFTQLFFSIVEEVSSQELISFNTLFSRLAYVGSKYGIIGKTLYGLHALRKKIESKTTFSEGDWDMGFWVLSQLLSKIYRLKIPVGLDLYEGGQIDIQRKKYSDYINAARVILLKIDPTLKTIVMVTQAEPGVHLTMVYDEVDINEDFTTNINSLERHCLLPMVAHLHHIRIDQKNRWHPEILVFEPDHLLDVTSVAGTFQPFGLFVEDYIIKRYLPKPSSIPLLVGIIANYFLDILIQDHTQKFEDVFPRTFALNPLAFSLLSDEEVRDIMMQSRLHFDQLKEAILVTFPRLDIDVKNILLEPSYYSPSYGLQGRLDILHERSAQDKMDIIELKSGKPFKPNIYGLSASHYIQTLLYDVIIKNIVKKNIAPTCYILYSKLSDRAMRHAPFVQSKIKEAMIARNMLILYEKIMAHGDVWTLLKNIKKDRFPHVRGFIADHIVQFESVLNKLDKIDQVYLASYSSFIAREQKLSKLGNDLHEVNGLSGLWQNTLDQKLSNYNIINHLVFVDLDTKKGMLHLAKSKETNPLSNFRTGDICILYADEDGQEDVLESHVLKGTIIEEDSTQIIVRLRSVTMTDHFFKRHRYWHLEHDLIDSSFTQLYRSLFSFMTASRTKKNRILGVDAPREYSSDLNYANPRITHEQAEVLKRMISSKDYFLLWGPPGTGKTSIMLKYYVEYLLQQTSEQLLIVSYTNRAVDEICRSISTINGANFVRIGSRYSCSPLYANQLLTNLMTGIKSRNEIKELFNSTRIIVGTISSINGKPELWKLKSFGRVIVDEASQILEPQIVGILSMVDHFTLIGDHRQLPAVTLQAKQEAVVVDSQLNDIGIHEMDVSLFERLYMRCHKMQWTHAYAMLSAQGRMHKDVMGFPSNEFYQDQLGVLEDVVGVTERLTQPWNWEKFSGQINLGEILSNRSIFYSVPIDLQSKNIKSNQNEAELVRDIILDLRKSILTERNYAIGVITPYRAQIATIRSILNETEMSLDDITIDTVERYQGGAKDIIIISMCINHKRQLDLLTRGADQLVDRKLNVALTRAKEQIIMIGNKAILYQSKFYKRFIDLYHVDR